MNNKTINYINKDFADLRSSLIEYAKAYFPTTYNDFSTASPGSMFIDLAAAVGDMLSFYLDNQIQETFLQYAKQPKNLYTMAYMLGYKPKITSAATVEIDVYQLLPSKLVSGNYVPDYDYALIIEEGMRVSAGTGTNTNFYIPTSVNFSLSSSFDPTEITVYSATGGNPDFFLLKKKTQAISGDVKTTTYSFDSPVKFSTVTLSDNNIIEILSVVDSDENKWYEVPYLAQDTILESVANLEGLVPNYSSNNNQVPYFLQVRKIPRRFVSRVLANNNVQIEFGPGINSVSDEAIIPNPNKVGIGTLDGLTKLNTAYDPSNFTTTYTYGLAPANTVLTFNYLVGGGATSNVIANSINNITNIKTQFFAGNVSSPSLGNIVVSSVSVNNVTPAVGGGDGDTLDQIRLNTLLQFPTQLRAVTQEDYLAHIYNMPPKYGEVSKAYITKDSRVYSNIIQQQPGVLDSFSTTIYVLGYNIDKNLVVAPLALKENIKTYISQYRMLTDTVNIRDAYIVNIGLDFKVILRPSFSGREVIAQCILKIRDYFNIDNWQINQPILLPDIYTLLDRIEGVQTVKSVEIVNKYGENNGYSPYVYDIPSATQNGVIYPSLDPSIFEIKYLNRDIRGKVVTF